MARRFVYALALFALSNSPALGAIVNVDIFALENTARLLGQYNINAFPIGVINIPVTFADEFSINSPGVPAYNFTDNRYAEFNSSSHSIAATSSADMTISTLPKTIDFFATHTAMGDPFDGQEGGSGSSVSDVEFNFDVTGSNAFLNIESAYSGTSPQPKVLIQLYQDNVLLTLPVTTVGIANIPQLSNYALTPGSYHLRARLSIGSSSNDINPFHSGSLHVSVVPESSTILFSTLGILLAVLSMRFANGSPLRAPAR